MWRSRGQPAQGPVFLPCLVLFSSPRGWRQACVCLGLVSRLSFNAGMEVKCISAMHLLFTLV